MLIFADTLPKEFQALESLMREALGSLIDDIVDTSLGLPHMALGNEHSFK